MFSFKESLRPRALCSIRIWISLKHISWILTFWVLPSFLQLLNQAILLWLTRASRLGAPVGGGCAARLPRSVKGLRCRSRSSTAARLETSSLQHIPVSTLISMHTTWRLPLSLSIFAPPSPICSPPPTPNSLFSSLLFLLCVSPSRYFSSGSVVCFQEIRPLLISHMSRVELGKAQCVCLFIVCACACSLALVCECVCARACVGVCTCVCVRAQVCTLMHVFKKRASAESDSKFSPLAASVLGFFEALIRPSSTTVWQSGKVTSAHCLTLLLLCKF